ncbi:MAG: hypothetical protein GY853_09450 [PVC group bacterium]|nr:hypothetical protein [PVC group bacterium]
MELREKNRKYYWDLFYEIDENTTFWGVSINYDTEMEACRALLDNKIEWLKGDEVE